MVKAVDAYSIDRYTSVVRSGGGDKPPALALSSKVEQVKGRNPFSPLSYSLGIL